MEGKKRLWLDIILVVIAMTLSVLVRLPSVFKNEEKFNNVYSSSEVDQEFIDEFYTEEDNPYLYDPDSYFYAKQAINLNQEPSIFSNFGKYNLLPFTTVVTYKALNPITHISLEALICYIGPFIFALSCIPAYIFMKKKTNRAGGFTAALLLGLSPALVSFSMAARFDTDILLTLLPTTMICAFILSIELKNNKKSYLCLAIATISYLLLTFTWESAPIYALLALMVSLIEIFSLLAKDKFKLKTSLHRKEFKIALIFPLILIIVSLIMHDHITSVFNLAALTISGTNDFPSPGTFVSELNSCPLYSGDIFGIFDTTSCGLVNLLGAFPLVIALGVSIVLFVQKNFSFLRDSKQKQNPLFLTSTVLIIWLLVGALSSGFGMRFIKNAAIPAALFAGLTIGVLYEKLHTSWRGKIIVLLVWVLVCLPSFRSYAIAQSIIPSANDSLAKTNSWLEENLGKDYSLVSWWDYGYFYEYGTSLNVVANGHTYNSHVYYWLASALVTEDELLSSRILKMLSNSELQAPELAKSIIGNYAESSKMLKQILIMSKNEAKDTLLSEYNFTTEQAEELLSLTHQDAKVAVAVTRNMLSIVEPIAFYGCWSFNDQFKSTEPACTENTAPSNDASNYPPYMIYRLYYEEKDTKYFAHSTRIYDSTYSLDSNIWTIK